MTRAGALVATLALAATAVNAPAQADTDHRQDGRKHGWITSTIQQMTIEEKVGQLFSTHVYGNTVDSQDPANVQEFGLATPREIIERYHLGGILYFAWTHSVDDPVQAAGLSNGIQDVMSTTGAGIPGMISIDQEGGLVARLLEPATQTPGNMALGATRDVQGARDLAAIQGKELAAIGVTQNFAPVADVNINPANPVIGVRSFSSDPQLTASLTAAQVRGYEDDAGISAAAKHFPGHGDTDVDSHYGFPVINHTREEWETIDRPPFQAAIDAGIDVIMTAHIQVPALDDSGDPATLSKPILTGVLRGEMGYDGVIVTDSLGMAGVREKYGDARVPVLALKAGVDILLNPPDMAAAYNGVLDAVRSGELTENRIDESLYRILDLKWDNGVIQDPMVDESQVMDVVGIDAHLARAQEVTDEVPTVVKNNEGTLPLGDEVDDVLVTGYGVATKQTLADDLAERGLSTRIATTGTNPSASQISAAAAAAEDADAAVVLTMNSADYARQAQLVEALEATGTPVVVVAVRNPYDISEFASAPTFMATYSYKAVALESLTKVLLGEVSPEGKLPVDIPAKDDPSSILFPFGTGLTW
ncbi:MAG TPA: glycoside hydrolase family 3 N-terminal domain-containing protein [Nocardioidaceae bacterium]|nr:glycoside hydrolase family 3 N-terminal domain-containing protein [Nocardioidaceae bacterium]